MHRRTALAGITAAAIGSLAAADWNNEFAHQIVKDFIQHWRLTREYCFAFLDAMPDEHLDFRPTPDQRTFAEQLTHFANSNARYFSLFKKQTTRPQPKEPQTRTRETVRQFMTASFDYVDSVLANFTEADFRRRDLPWGSRNPKHHTAHDLFLRAMTHTAHHRGQIVTYLRLKGIAPPRWRFQANG